jgi:peptide/nickel transport system ATP-binding protein
MTRLKNELGTAMLLITHDLGVVAEICDRVAILYAGDIVEMGNLRHIFRQTSHPYTEGLIGSLPKINEKTHRLSPIKGLMPDPAKLPPGCSFSPRCKYAKSVCGINKPMMLEIDPGHFVRCLKFQEGGAK